jgi:CBS domain-containing protein
VSPGRRIARADAVVRCWFGNQRVLNVNSKIGVMMADNSETRKPSGSQEQVRAAASSAVQSAAETAQRGTEAMQQTGRSSGETLRRGSEAGAQTMQHFGGLAGETMRRGSEGFAGAQQKLAQDAARQFEETIGKWSQMLQTSAQQWRTLMHVPNSAGGGVQELQRCVGGAVERVMQTNMQATQELFRLTNTAGFAELQQRFMREYLNALLEGSSNIVRAVRQSADQTLRPLEEHAARQHNGQEQSGRVADVMEREVRVANPDDTVQQVARMMRETDTGALPVGEGDRLVGMVTDRDVTVRLVAEGRDPARTKVREVMSPEVRYVFEDEDVGHVADNMAEQQVRRLPVMNRQKRLVGVVSLGDIAKGRRPELAGSALRGIAREGGQHTQTAAE